jgi:hypothetical protein
LEAEFFLDTFALLLLLDFLAFLQVGFLFLAAAAAAFCLATAAYLAASCFILAILIAAAFFF